MRQEAQKVHVASNETVTSSSLLISLRMGGVIGRFGGATAFLR